MAKSKITITLCEEDVIEAVLNWAYLEELIPSKADAEAKINIRKESRGYGQAEHEENVVEVTITSELNRS